MAKAVLPHMWEQGHGRIINLSSVQGFIPAPYMAVYGASKHAIEGYSQSLDHEIREHGIRSLLVDPANTKTGFEAKRVMAEAFKVGDDPAVVADVIVAAAPDPKPKLRYTAGTLAGRAGALRRFAPARIFDSQIRAVGQDERPSPCLSGIIPR